MKKVLIIVVVLLIVALGVGAYFYFTRNNVEGPGAANNGGGSFDPGSVNNGGATNLVPGLQLLISGPVAGFWLDETGVAYGVGESGQITKALPDGATETLSTQAMEEVFFVSGSKTGKDVMVGFMEDGKKSFRLFNVLAKTWRTLPLDTVAAAWGDQDDRIAYLMKVGGGGGLVLSLLDVQSGVSQSVVKIDLADTDIFWPAEDVVYLVEKPSRVVESRIIRVDLKNGVSQIIKKGYGLSAVALDRDSLLVFSSNSGLFTMNAFGEVATHWQNIVTLPEKCDAGKDILFCGVSRNLSLADFPDKYLQRQVYSGDFLEAGRLGTNNSLALVGVGLSEELLVDVWRPIIRGGRGFFINRYDGSLYSLSLGVELNSNE